MPLWGFSYAESKDNFRTREAQKQHSYFPIPLIFPFSSSCSVWIPCVISRRIVYCCNGFRLIKRIMKNQQQQDRQEKTGVNNSNRG
jgi:hypothetical protein